MPDELRQSDLEREYTELACGHDLALAQRAKDGDTAWCYVCEKDVEVEGWRFWRGVNGLPYGRKPKTSPPNTMWGEDWTDLRDNVRGWLEARHQ
jgi:hypothetical protein